MKLVVFKGFDNDYIKRSSLLPLIDMPIEAQRDIFSFDQNLKKSIVAAVLTMSDADERWITYEEFSFVKDGIELAIKDYDLELTILQNNLFPDIYPVACTLSEDLLTEIDTNSNENSIVECSAEYKKFSSIYSSIARIDSCIFGTFFNYEYDKDLKVKIAKGFPELAIIETDNCIPDLRVYLNNDLEAYLKVLDSIAKQNLKTISVAKAKGEISDRILSSLLAYCKNASIKVVEDRDCLNPNPAREQELIDIAKKEIGIPGFTDFRKIKFYKSPDINKDVVEIKQSQIINEIITQAENAYKTEGSSYRDIFITASTGAGKSVMFQIPAVYLAKNYGKLTIIIEPVKALMQDQKEQLNKRGYDRVETFNSDLITQAEKEAVLQRVKDGEVDLLYLSPETLLSYSIETLIGDREIGLLIVDEAHIVTTWGVGFRPDYWYLGGYINSIRNILKYGKKAYREPQHFPICAFTATAINGGIDDSVSETIISLYMNNPIKYIGYVKRDDIRFDINVVNNTKQSKNDYEEAKALQLKKRVDAWTENNKKTIVYFPYASYARDAQSGIRSFSGLELDRERIGMYIGRNIYEQSATAFASVKREAFEKFRSGENIVMFATKAFGMGVDIDDIENVYHYAVTGNLCDYVQEIGRVARKPSLVGYAVTDYFYNDISFMQKLFGMSQIRQYQINLVLSGIYNTFKSKKEKRNFLISPESFTYIFNDKDEKSSINKLKTCLLMIEKDLADKYNYKVLISRPQSVFTKAYVVIKRENESDVLNSKYGKCFNYVASGRNKEKLDNVSITDVGDIYLIDLKAIWEEYYRNISFPQFKFWYFNAKNDYPDKISIMPEIQPYIFPRQRIQVETTGERKLYELRNLVLEDIDYIADTLYSNFRRVYFTTQDVTNVLSEKYGKTKAKIIANSLFDLADPKGWCVKRRYNEDSFATKYTLSNGAFKEILRKPITKSSIMNQMSNIDGTTYSQFSSILSGDDVNSITLKLLAILDYITYEMVGGEEPEIFIRLNDPEKIRRIATKEVKYSNEYVTKAKSKHARDVAVLRKFFTEIEQDAERWEYIEDYFLGRDVIGEDSATIEGLE